jgi:hypothetical protein
LQTDFGWLDYASWLMRLELVKAFAVIAQDACFSLVQLVYPLGLVADYALSEA